MADIPKDVPSMHSGPFNTPEAAIAWLRALAADLLNMGYPSADQFAERLKSYEGGASATLDQAIGLTPARGKPTWRASSARNVRDQALRKFRNHERFADLGVAEVAREILRTEERLRRASRSQFSAGTPESLIAEACASGARFPEERQLRNILQSGNQTPPSNFHPTAL